MIKNYIKNCEKYSILISILMIVLSVILILNPIKSVKVLIQLFGVILLINGVSSIISYFFTEKEDRLFSLDLLIGLSTIVFGILVIIYCDSLINVLPIIVGIWMIFNNLIKMQLSINLSFIDGLNWIWLLIVSIIFITLGIVLIVYPFASTIAITTVVGVIVLISEVINLIDSICLLIKINRI